MTRVPLIQGAYSTRSVIANAQRCVNLYGEPNTQDADAPMTFYLTPGLTTIAQAPNVAEFRGLYLSSNNKLYGVVGNKVYYIDGAFAFTDIGTIVSSTGQVYMADNGTTMVIVTGTSEGYTVDIATNAFAQIIDTAFYGGTSVDYLDTFLVFSKPNSRTFYSTLSNQITPFDPLYFADKVGYPDQLAALRVMHREIWLFGAQRATEIWYLEGSDSGFPFSRLPGSYIEQGCLAADSIAKNDLKLFWLGQNQNGSASVFVGQNYRSQQISTFAIENEINSYPLLSDAIGMTYNQQGHDFYMLTFPTADKTWCFDSETQQWHERTWTDSNGVEHRHRANCMASAYGKNLCGDWENGKLYVLDPNNGTDFGGPIVRRRGFPHIVADGKRLRYDCFQANMDCGNLTGHLSDDPAEVSLRVSLDRGHSFGNPILQSMGSTGQYLVQPQWRNLGIGRDAVFELFWSSEAFTALQGAWVDGAGAAT